MKKASQLFMLSMAFLFTTASFGADKGQALAAKMLAAGDIVWEPYGGGVPLEVAPLWGDRTKGEFGILLKFPPKFEAGMHTHTADYHGINLQGTWIHSIEGGKTMELPPMSYVMQPGKQSHNDVCKGPSECIIFVHMESKHDYIPAKRAAKGKK